MDFRAARRRGLLVLLLSICAAACSEPGDDTPDVSPDTPNVAAADPPTMEAQAQCEWERGFRISRDSIGPLATTDPVGVVKELCSQTRDTLSQSDLMIREGSPGIVIPVPGGEVYGVQRPLDVLDPERRVTDWLVTGDGALPEGLSMKSTWGDLSRAYGSGYAAAEPAYPDDDIPSYVSVDFELYPGLTFYLENLDSSALRPVNRFEIWIEMSSIPDSATIQRVWVETEWYYR